MSDPIAGAVTSHALYRFRDAAGALLYVGVTNNPSRRFGQHAAGKPWWHEVATIAMEPYPDRAAVLAAERAAIRTESPRYNVIHASVGVAAAPAPTATDADPSEFPVTPGDVVALGLAPNPAGDIECVVGRVEAVNDFGVKVSQLKWLAGYFDSEVTVAWHRVLEIKFAYPMSESQAERQGYGRTKDIFDCDPLADFQTQWEHGRAYWKEAKVNGYEAAAAKFGK